MIIKYIIYVIPHYNYLNNLYYLIVTEYKEKLN